MGKRGSEEPDIGFADKMAGVVNSLGILVFRLEACALQPRVRDSFLYDTGNSWARPVSALRSTSGSLGGQPGQCMPARSSS